ncbi:hypothetical protein [Billgrantia gudaonensis]|uniref:Uncharacterized protein n=1 Tax=Billgrantia gudaonensis TaxID=376427 RepID=A0A1G8XID1_9GAMM|nr:hypothetical protein [Halomonas gudaonensis]SDJ89530.1 hypothetical protein SAMN04487954_10930 [Halomonas gudaonensis]
MMITQRDRNITLIDQKPRRTGGATQPTFWQRCRDAGRDPKRIRHLMETEGMTLEQALAVPPMDHSQVGRTGKQRSYWRRLGEAE